MLSLPAAIGYAALALEAKAVSAQPHFHVELVFEGTPMPPQIEASAMKEARLIWAQYGVDVQASGASQDKDRSVRLVVTLVDRELGRGSPEALGKIRFDDGLPEPAIAVYPNVITALVSTVDLYGRNEGAWPIAMHDLIVGRALGRALAHEIGHFLLRTRLHSRTGLMRALQPIRELIAEDRRQFVLSPDEVARLGVILDRRLTEDGDPAGG
jgi:hypothetical protein